MIRWRGGALTVSSARRVILQRRKSPSSRHAQALNCNRSLDARENFLMTRRWTRWLRAVVGTAALQLLRAGEMSPWL